MENKNNTGAEPAQQPQRRIISMPPQPPGYREKVEKERQKKRWSWENIPDPIDESLIVETITKEVVVVGGGIAGMATGARCSELGLKTIVIEKYKGIVARGAHFACLDSSVMREKGVHIDKQQFARDWMRICGSRVNEDLLWLYINQSEAALEWLRGIGGDDVTVNLFGGNYKGPDFTEYLGTHIFSRKPESTRYRYTGGSMLMCEMMQNHTLEHGGEILRNTHVKQLERKDGRVTGVIALCEDGKYRRYVGTQAVILATGDIGGDPEMLAAYAPLALECNNNGYFPAGLNTGDGHKMAYWVGAQFEAGTWAVCLHLIAYSMFVFYFLHVNREGKRYMNEDTWAQAKSIRTMMQPEGDFAYSIFDDKWFEDVGARVGKSGGQFCEPLMVMYGDKWTEDNGVRDYIDRYIQNGTCQKADTIEELAEKINVPAEELKKTVARYNEMYRQGKDTDYGKRAEMLTSIDKPPYYALKFGPALLNVHGGVLTDTSMHVLDSKKQQIPGLYAVGNVAGGLYGVDYPLLLNGNSHGRAVTWARQAADTILAEKQKG